MKCCRIPALCAAAATALRRCAAGCGWVFRWEGFAANQGLCAFGTWSMRKSRRSDRGARVCTGSEFGYTLHPRASCRGRGVASQLLPGRLCERWRGWEGD